MLGRNSVCGPLCRVSISLTLALFVHTLPSGLSAYAQDEYRSTKVSTEGFWPGQGISARSKAVANAEREALLVYLETLFDPLDSDFVAPLLDRGRAYFQSSRVVRQERTSEGTRVAIEAYLLDGKLRRDAATLLLSSLKNPPKVLILFAERPSSDVSWYVGAAGAAETTLVDAFVALNFEVLDSRSIRESYAVGELLPLIESGPQTIGKFGRENRADVVIVGTSSAEAKPVPTSSGMWRVKARVELRLVHAWNETLLGKIAREAVVTGAQAEEAARQATLDACKKLQDFAMVESTLALARAANNRGLWLTVEGPGDRTRLSAILRALEDDPAVVDFEELRHSETLAKIRVNYAGTVKTFVENLTGRSFPDFTLSPYRVIGEEVWLTLAER